MLELSGSTAGQNSAGSLWKWYIDFKPSLKSNIVYYLNPGWNFFKFFIMVGYPTGQ